MDDQKTTYTAKAEIKFFEAMAKEVSHADFLRFASGYAQGLRWRHFDFEGKPMTAELRHKLLSELDVFVNQKRF